MTNELQLVTPFQFQLGAIGRKLEAMSPQRTDVSIPAWCDWEIDFDYYDPFRYVFQFQLGAIGSFIGVVNR